VRSVQVHWQIGHNSTFMYSKSNLFHHIWSDKAATEYKNRAKCSYDKIGLQSCGRPTKSRILFQNDRIARLVETGDNIYLNIVDDIS